MLEVNEMLAGLAVTPQAGIQTDPRTGVYKQPCEPAGSCSIYAKTHSYVNIIASALCLHFSCFVSKCSHMYTFSLDLKEKAVMKMTARTVSGFCSSMICCFCFVTLNSLASGLSAGYRD